MSDSEIPRHPYLYRIYDKRANTWTWVVSITRKGVAVTKSFTEIKYGGMEEAIAQAIAFRDKILKDMLPYSAVEQRAIIRKSNTSGVPGVVYRGPGKDAWVAIIQLPDGRQKSKAFSVKKYGEQAKALAIAMRKTMLAEVEGYFMPGAAHTREVVQAQLPNTATKSDDPPLALPKQAIVRCMDYRDKQPTDLTGIKPRYEAKAREGDAPVLAYWTATYVRNGHRKSRNFSVKLLGEEEAYRQALAQRLAWETEYGPLQPRKRKNSKAPLT